MTPKGFQFSAVRCGIKSKGNDVAVIASMQPANAAAVFTTTKVFAAPIQVSREHLAAGKGIQAIVVNSGNANACTGEEGVSNARKACALVAERLAISPEQVMVASTGIIGRQMPMDKLEVGIMAAFDSMTPDDFAQVADAIMTTDTFMKNTSRPVELAEGCEAIIAGVTKGAGMISPKMATMLCFIVTDAAIEPECAQLMLSKAVEASFNHVVIDGDMSTNDCCMLLYNGAAGNEQVTLEHPRYKAFEWSLTEVCSTLARMMARDGEGATKLVEVRVKGAASPEDAELCARAVATSPLCKTAFFGSDPNWGRLCAAAGRSGAEVDRDKLDLYFNETKIVEDGREVEGSYGAAKQIALEDEYIITIDLNLGEADTWIWTCDLSYDYVQVNAEYHT